MIRRIRSSRLNQAFVEYGQARGFKIDPARVRSPQDNAVAESFFASFKTELIYRNVLATARHAKELTVAWFERYNRVRRHSHCGNQAPLTYEEATTVNTTRAA